MESTVEFWLGFAVNLAGSAIMLWPCFGFLTLKENRSHFEVLLYICMLTTPAALVKYGGGVNFNMIIVFDIVINIILLIWLKWAFCDNLMRCIAAQILMLGNGFIGSSLWMLLYGNLNLITENPVHLYLTHMLCVLIASSVFFFVLKRLKLKDWPESRGFTIFAACVILNVLALTDMAQGFIMKTSRQPLLDAIPNTTFMIECLTVIYIIYRLCIQKEKQDRLAELSALKKHEEENYDRLCRRTEQMAKLRHDFKGQLFAARHIASVDYDEGVKMMEELRTQMQEAED